MPVLSKVELTALSYSSGSKGNLPFPLLQIQRASYGLEFINQTGKYREQQISRARKNWAVGRYLARNIASARSVMRGVCP
ncbi:hypothetical protein J6590_027135 [Homalodisca vitripennis]|nr:hypothetical protein J6590_027135 [Homalodisca vitripennis]